MSGRSAPHSRRHEPDGLTRGREHGLAHGGHDDRATLYLSEPVIYMLDWVSMGPGDDLMAGAKLRLRGRGRTGGRTAAQRGQAGA